MGKVIFDIDFMGKKKKTEFLEEVLKEFDTWDATGQREIYSYVINLLYDRGQKQKELVAKYNELTKQYNTIYTVLNDLASLEDDEIDYIREGEERKEETFQGMIIVARKKYIPFTTAINALKSGGFTSEELSDCKDLQEVVNKLWDRYMPDEEVHPHKLSPPPKVITKPNGGV